MREESQMETKTKKKKKEEEELNGLDDKLRLRLYCQ